jgi:uncharacterized repeat protein (TIGR01451 family)
VPAKPAFTIEKQQRLKGQASYTTAELTGEIGETVEYKVIVKNTGNTTIKFSKLTDANCEGISPSGEVQVAAGGEQVYTCSHVLTSIGKYTNEATITGAAKTQTSNKVTVNVPAKPAFTIEKQQRLKGEASYTTATLTGAVGQTVEYKIIVKNTGNTSLKFGKLTDAKCEGISPSGEVELTSGGEQVYTCSHVLTTADQTAGSYENNATITGTPPTGQGSPITHTSNTVVVNVPTPPTCSMDKIKSNFDGTKVEPIAGEPQWVWFNSVIKQKGVTSSGGTIKVTNQHITIKLHSGEVITVSVPNATLIFFTTTKTGQGSTEFKGGEWVTRVPIVNGKVFGDDIFMAGLAWHIPAGVQIASAEPVTWEADFTASAGMNTNPLLEWQWAAAVYSKLSATEAGYNEMEVKPLHSTTEDKYPTGDNAGTPEKPAVQALHTEGARGGGGSNYTGSYSGTEKCPDPPTEYEETHHADEGDPTSAVEIPPVWPEEVVP